MGDVIPFPVGRTRRPAKAQPKRAKRERTVHTPKRTITVVEKSHD